MKRRDLERELRQAGWWLSWHGGKHDIWTNGEEQEAVPRHNEINEYTAKKIIKTVHAASKRIRDENYGKLLEK